MQGWRRSKVTWVGSFGWREDLPDSLPNRGAAFSPDPKIG
ncbi:hypothetical protein BF49_4491 [Bradyrhizobium sp.]|nr:hypothetical protein BF49_4491 [Bradyrhizobium sp.]